MWCIIFFRISISWFLKEYPVSLRFCIKKSLAIHFLYFILNTTWISSLPSQTFSSICDFIRVDHEKPKNSIFFICGVSRSISSEILIQNSRKSDPKISSPQPVAILWKTGNLHYSNFPERFENPRSNRYEKRILICGDFLSRIVDFR